MESRRWNAGAWRKWKRSEDMVNYKTGKLQRADKKVLLRDEKQVLKDSKELIRQSKKDMFQPAKLTLRQIVERDKQIDEQLSSLEGLRGTAMKGHSEYAELKEQKRQLKAQKKLLKLEKQKREGELAIKSESPESSLSLP